MSSKPRLNSNESDRILRGPQSLTHLDSGKHAPTGNIARAVANGCMSSEHGDIDVVTEVVVTSRKLRGKGRYYLLRTIQ